MDENQWLQMMLEAIQKDVDEIKQEIKAINEFRFKLAGSAMLASLVISAGINVLMLWMKNK